MLPAWPFYLLGVLLAVVGFAALRRVVDEARDYRRSTGPVAPLACLLAFILCGSAIVTAMILDSAQTQVENTRTFSLHIAVVPESPGPFSVSLPAPADPRVQGQLNRTNGSSTLRFVNSTGVPYLRVDASGSASFDLVVTVIGEPINRTLTGSSAGPPSDGMRSASVTIGLQAPGNVSVTFAARYSEFCAVTTFVLEAVVDRSATYTGLWTVQLLGCTGGS